MSILRGHTAPFFVIVLIVLRHPYKEVLYSA